jgi:hypothetical protein
MALPNLFRLVGALLALSLYAVPVYAQETQLVPGMAESERKERCANNRARLDELNAQILANQPLGPAAIKQANDDVIDVGVLAAKGGTFTPMDYVNFGAISYRYGFNPSTCQTQGVKECGAELLTLIHKQITDSETRESSLKALKDQAQMHETNLVALYCTEAVLDVVGDWRSDFGAFHVTSTVSGFTATYDYATGGSISGSFDGHKVDGIWAHTLSQRSCSTEKLGTSHWGRIAITFADDGKSFAGRWGYCDDPPTEAWNGTRAGAVR